MTGAVLSDDLWPSNAPMIGKLRPTAAPTLVVRVSEVGGSRYWLAGSPAHTTRPVHGE